jgi:hypothetical protein
VTPRALKLRASKAPILQLCLAKMYNVGLLQNNPIRTFSLSTLNRSQGRIGAGYIERFEHEFLALRKHHSPSWSLAFTEAGLVLGAGTLVAPMRRGAAALDLSGEDRILALLAVAFAAPVDAAVLAKLRLRRSFGHKATNASRKFIWRICARRNSKARNRRSGSSSPIV